MCTESLHTFFQQHNTLGQTLGLYSHSNHSCIMPQSSTLCWAEAHIKIARMTLTVKLDRNWSSFQLANSAPPLSVTDSAIAPSARIPLPAGSSYIHCFPVALYASQILARRFSHTSPHQSGRGQATSHESHESHESDDEQ